MPLVVMFELPITGCFQAFPDVESPFIQNLQSRYSVQVSFRARSRGPRPGVVVIKGSEADVMPLKEAVKILVDYFCGSLAVSEVKVASRHGRQSALVFLEPGAGVHDPRDFTAASRSRAGLQQDEPAAHPHHDGHHDHVPRPDGSSHSSAS